MAHTFRCEYVKCGKPGCGTCPHGPYWYEYWHVKGKMHKRYHGKQRPASTDAELKADPGNRLDDIFDRRLATARLAREILGLATSGNVTTSQVNAAFKQRSMATHPDRGGSQRDFQRVNAAYSYLKNMY